jgi:hypothetical protein
LSSLSWLALKTTSLVIVGVITLVTLTEAERPRFVPTTCDGSS